MTIQMCIFPECKVTKWFHFRPSRGVRTRCQNLMEEEAIFHLLKDPIRTKHYLLVVLVQIEKVWLRHHLQPETSSMAWRLFLLFVYPC